MIFFTSDLHFGHSNIVRMCNRPFATIEEMDEQLIRNWNRKVHKCDTVYILGDFIFRNEKPPEYYLDRLKGKKHLIVGNHDRHWMRQGDYTHYFEIISNLLEFSDGQRKIAACHYPMMAWPGGMKAFMLFGHIHGDTDMAWWPIIQQSEKMLNVGVDVNGYEPVTFDELVENNRRYKNKDLI